jgi:uncharacterized protein YecE (DUF72 family)
MSQLPLFGPEPPEASTAPERASDLVATHADALAIARRLPVSIRFGTSSWSFPGWVGLVYRASATTSSLARDGLREYASHPLLRAVGLDRSFYAPVPAADLRHYAAQLPPGFPCLAKVPASVVSPVVPPFGARARAAPNPWFLSAGRLIDELLEPCAAVFRAHTGPFVLEIPPAPRGLALEPAAFLERLEAMLVDLPRDFEYAVELREQRLLTPEYARVLARHGAGHVYNYWSAMPLPGRQAEVAPLDLAPFVVMRLLLRPGTWYEDQRERFRPFDRLVAPDEAMRADVVRLARGGLAAGRRVYVLVNNKAEGSAPLTVRALAGALADAFASETTHALGTTPGP